MRNNILIIIFFSYDYFLKRKRKKAEGREEGETGEEGGWEKGGGGRSGEGGPSSSAHGASEHKTLHNFCTSAPAGPKYVFQVAMKG